MRVIAVSHHDPRFLKPAYAHPYIDLIDSERHIKAGTRYIAWDGRFRVYKMTRERVPIPLGAFDDIRRAVFTARI